MLNKISHIVTNYPLRILAFWLIITILAIPLTLNIDSVLSNNTGFVSDGEAQSHQKIIESSFLGGSNTELILTVESIQESDSIDHLSSSFFETLDKLKRLSIVKDIQTSASQPLIPNFSPKIRSSLAIIELEAKEFNEIMAATELIKKRLPKNTNLNYHLTGWPAVSHEIQKISKADSLRAEVIGLSISLVILALVFGSIVAAILPLLVAITSIILSLALLFIIGQFIPITSFGEIIISLLGLATGIDYALLMVNRFREELLNGLEPKLAAKKTISTAGKSVLISGLTVLIALSALLVPPLSFVRSLGLTSIIVMFFSVSVSITLMPAIFTLLGRNINLLKITRREPGTRTRKFWGARAENIMKFPWLWSIFGITILLAISLPALSMQVDVSGVRGLTKETEIRKAQVILERLKLDSLQRSIDIMVDFGERGFYHPSSIRKIAKLTRAADKLDHVESSFSALSSQGMPALLVQQYYATKDLALESPLSTLVQRTISEDGRYALIRIFPKNGVSPSIASGILANLRKESSKLELKTIFGGSYLNDKEFADVLYGSFPLAILLVYLATFILLGLAFKSILIPIKSILLNTLAVGAAFGVITAVFQFGWFAPLFGLEEGLGFIETIVPVFIFAVIFGLSMDYEVFLVSRIYEGHKQGLSDKEAVKSALSSTGSVISSASLIMIVVFMVFIASRVVLIKTLSLGLSVAILLDATLVRSTLVPAIMSLAGRWNWYMPEFFVKFADKINLSHD